MNIDKWDLFAICESILFVSDKPVTVEQVVNVLEREHEEALERAQDEEDERARLGRIANAEVRDAAFDMTLRSDTAEAQLEAPVAEASTTLEGFEELPAESLPADEVAEEAQKAREAASPEAMQKRKLRRELTRLVEDAFAALMHAYADPARSTGRGLQLVNVAGAYQFRTNPDCAPFVMHHLQVKPTKLSRAQVETLAIIAYRQPVTRPEMEHIRGVDCGAALKILLDRKLVRILGKKEEVGRPLLYGTTKEFLEFFNLGSLLELPTLREFQELSDEHKKKIEEELEADAPLGDLKSLAEGQPTFQVDDSALLHDVDAALQGAKQTVNRVAELTGMKSQDESEA